MIVSEVEALTNLVAGMAQVKQLTAGSIHHQYQYQSESEYLALPILSLFLTVTVTVTVTSEQKKIRNGLVW